MELYLGDLTVNGQKIDLSQDPHWEGRNNESRYTEPNFQAMHSYGWSQTNWAGEKPGEIGGLFWRTEPPDPLCSYYGDDVGELTLDDPISFSGTICFTDGMTDAAAYLRLLQPRQPGRRSSTRRRSDAFSPVANTMGITIADSSAVGYYFLPQVSSAEPGGRAEVLRGLHARPHAGVDSPSTTTRRATAATGRVTVTLDGHEVGVRPDARAAEGGGDVQPLRAGERPQRRPFGRVLPGRPDLHGSRPPRPKPVPQTPVEVPYPHKQAGRRY